MQNKSLYVREHIVIKSSPIEYYLVWQTSGLALLYLQQTLAKTLKINLADQHGKNLIVVVYCGGQYKVI